MNSSRKSSHAPANLYSAVASKILKESLHINKGESLTIETWNSGQSLAKQLVVEARKLGVIPVVVFEDEEAYVESAKNMDKDYRGKMGKQEYALLSGSDTYVFIPGPPLSAFYSGLTSEERAASTGYNSSWYEAAEKGRLRGVRLSFGYVGKDMAGVLGRSKKNIAQHQLQAIIKSDFGSMSNNAKQIAQYMRDGSTCTVSSGTSVVEFKLQGDTEIEDGVVDDDTDVSEGANMAYLPPGLVAKRVDSASVSGKIGGFEAATPFGLIKDGLLEFESGNLVRWESKKSKKAVDRTVLAIKEDSRKILQVTIGLNPFVKLGYGIDRFAYGVVSLNIGYRLTTTLQRATISVDGKVLLSSGKIV